MYKLILIFFLSSIFCQFNTVDINIEGNRLSENEKYIIQNLDERIQEYFQLNNFCNDCDDVDINLNIHIIIESIVTTSDFTGSINKINGYIIFSNNSDLYYFDKNFNISYNSSRNFTFNPYIYDGPESLFNYYAYLFIGYALDTIVEKSGTKYFNKSIEIAEESDESFSWKDKVEEVNLIVENTMLRKARFLYFDYLNTIHSNDYKQNMDIYLDELDFMINEFNEQIVDIYNKIGQDKNTLKFIGHHSRTIGELYKKHKLFEGLDFLMIYDSENKHIYREYAKWESNKS